MKKFLFALLLVIINLTAHAQFVANTAVNKTYRAETNIPIQLIFASPVTVTGTPQISLTVGSTTVTAPYAFGSGTRTLTFHYLVAPGDTDTDGITLDSNIDLNGGTLKYNGDLDCTPTIGTQTNINTVKVDTEVPTLISLTSPPSKTYFAGQDVTFTATYSEKLYPTGSPFIQLDLGGRTVNAVMSGYATTTLYFKYTVTTDDVNVNGLTVISPINLNGGLIKDLAGNTPSLSFTPPDASGISLSGVNPAIESVVGPAAGTYSSNQNIDFSVTFNKPVNVSGIPKMPISLSSVYKEASYISGSGSSTLIFRYTVESGFNAPSGIYLPGVFNLNGGSIKDFSNNNALLLFSKKILDGLIVEAPQATIISVSTPANPPLRYVENDVINFTVVFSEPIFASRTTSFISVNVGGSSVNATYASGSGTDTFIYSYQVASAMEDLDGVELSNSIIPGGGAILSSLGGAKANLNFTPPNSTSIRIDSKAPFVTDNNFPANGMYLAGQNLNFTVTFQEDVVVTGNPRLVVNIGGNLQRANYLSGSGTPVLTFRYLIGDEDNAPQGISLLNALDTTLGSIADSSGNISSPRLVNMDAPLVVVFGADPIIVSVTPPANKIYLTGENIDFQVKFSRVVTVTGTPIMPITLNGFPRNATYLSGSGTNTLVFRYRVAAGFSAPNGVYIKGALELNGGSIKDSSNNNSDLNYEKKILSGIIVNSPGPTITAISSPALPQSLYIINENIDFTVTFSEPIFASKTTSRLRLNIGGSNQFASYLSGSGTNTFTYRYTVAPYKFTNTGIQVVSPLILNQAALTNADGGNIQLGFSTFTVPAINIDSMLPTIISNSVPLAGNYGIGQHLTFAVDYSRTVTVSGNPKIEVRMGPLMDPQPRYANYVSGSGSTQLTFQYQIEASDLDDDGLNIRGLINVDDGTMIDEVGNDGAIWMAGTTLKNLDLSMVKVNANANITGISTPVNAKYSVGQNLDFQVSFNKTVSVTFVPRIGINVGGITRYANYVSGTGSNTLLFRYTVQPSHMDADGITLVSPIELNGGTIQDLSLENANLGFTVPDTSGIFVDGFDPVISSVTPPVNKTYLINEQINFVVNYTSSVNVVGAPYLPIVIGSTSRNATYISGSGSTTLTFRYTVQSGDLDVDGIAISSPIILNGGSINDPFGDAAGITFTPPDTTGVLVSAVPVTISSVAGPAPGTYQAGSFVDFSVSMSEAVEITGTPRITLTVGSATKYAEYTSGNGSSSLTFRYVPDFGDSDSNGIASSSPLDLNGGAVKNLAGVELSSGVFTPPNTSAVLINTSVGITNVSPPANGVYTAGANLDFTFTYSNTVKVGGAPRVAITVGSTTAYANYISGHNSNTLIFRYTVASGQVDGDGITLISPIQLNGGSIRDSGNQDSALTYATPDTSGILINAGSLNVASVTPPANNNYRINFNLNFTVNFSDAAIVSGTPRLLLNVGGSTRYATYLSGSGTSSLIFRYTVTEGDSDNDGIATTGPAIDLNGGTIQNSFGTNANLAFTAATYAGVLVDGVRPFASAAIASANGTYSVGQNINITLTYSEIVNFVGTPRISLIVGATTRYANYFSGTGTNTIVFQYTVLAGDADNNGISISPTVTMNGGAITDNFGNTTSTLNFPAIDSTGILVNGSNIGIAYITGPSPQTYGNNANLNFIVNFSLNVNVTGSPTLSLNVGGAIKNATYISGSGTSALVFRYTTVNGDSDTNGVNTVSPLLINGGTIQGPGGEGVDLTFIGSNYAGVNVDALAPVVSLVSLPANNTYQSAGSRPNLSFTVTFNEVVTVVGTPRINLTIGATTRYANYVSGSGSTSLVFNYLVAAADLDLDGISIGNSSSIDLNGGTIRDALLNNANLSMGILSTNKIFVVLPSMYAWFDLTDSSKITLSGNNVKTLLDKINANNLTHSLAAGVPYSVTNFNGGTNAYASCAVGSSFVGARQTSPVAIIAVFRAPANTTNQHLFYLGHTGRPRVNFTSTASGGTVTFGSVGSKYAANAWTTPADTTTNVWAANGYHARAFSWSYPQSRDHEICSMSGQLAELIWLNDQPTTAQMMIINSYIFSRYGLNL